MISICLCTYNGERYLREQLDSLMGQTVLPDEIIICDDASTDETCNIIQEYVDVYTQIVWKVSFCSVNTGWRVNFKNALKQAQGDIIFLCDQDDIWNEDKIEIMSKVMCDDLDIGVLVADYQPFYMDGAVEHNLRTACKNTFKVSKIPLTPRLIYCERPGCVFALRSSMKIPFFECWQSDFAHDALLWRIAALQKKLYHLDYNAIRFRRHNDNASSVRISQLSQDKRQYEKELIAMYLRCFGNIKENLKLQDDARNTLDGIIDYFLLREKHYENPSVKSFFELVKKKEYYISSMSCLKEMSAFLRK